MADSYAKINKTLISTQVEDQMMEYILGECNVGDKLPNEFELAKKFDTSRSTIREVMKTIASHGIVEIRHGSGTYVISKSPKIADSDPLHLSGRKDKYRLALELFDVRLMLEPEIAAMAADLRTKEQAKEVLRLCDEVEALYESGADHSKKDAEFHACIAACSGNLVVQSLVPIIQSAIITFCNVTQRKLKNETIITHRAITNAILNKDAIGARCAMITHLSSNRDAILEMIRKREKSSDDF
ncbi:MAG: FadR family transcriptional regulator [Butyrivibrio sp.]|uniref:FadR/GntR family transcriptional regulator n=1 Tax=Butyrivibrio sp. TaxID=28121 RepID=UPI0025FD8F7F|nr:FadR/GntR family transcriptional regulator [Butyrivibrio sp.]MCR5770717.1 FadR family transcriptional regulator [Butyrivibrio sp.]